MSEIDLKLIVPTAIAVVSLLVSLGVAFRNWRYSDTSVRYTSRNQYMSALFDIDLQLVNRPELWAIYDDHPMSASHSNEPEAVSRRQAFLYFPSTYSKRCTTTIIRPRSASRPISPRTMCAAGIGASPPWALSVLSDM